MLHEPNNNYIFNVIFLEQFTFINVLLLLLYCDAIGLDWETSFGELFLTRKPQNPFWCPLLSNRVCMFYFLTKSCTSTILFYCYYNVWISVWSYQSHIYTIYMSRMIAWRKLSPDSVSFPNYLYLSQLPWGHYVVNITTWWLTLVIISWFTVRVFSHGSVGSVLDTSR